jgi:hypothetical protein
LRVDVFWKLAPAALAIGLLFAFMIVHRRREIIGTVSLNARRSSGRTVGQ